MNTTLEERQKVAIEKFSAGYNCAQSVVYAYQDKLSVDVNTAVRLATGFGAGFGRKQEICGALSGGILVLSSANGRGLDEEKAKTEIVYTQTRDLVDSFTKTFGTCRCRELLGGCDLATQEGQLEFKEKKLLDAVCKKCVESVVRIVAEKKFV